MLSPKDERAVADATNGLSYCPDRCPIWSAPRRSGRRHVERLIAIYRKDADAIQNAEHPEERGTMRELLESIERNLILDRCDPVLGGVSGTR